MARKAISKRSRFEVFKRDGFVCQYCGNHPPEVVLEVDHIDPVSKGGTDERDNLITSCFNCNRGKSDVLLSIIPQSLTDKAKEISEREDQILEYQKIMQERRDRIDEEIWSVLSVIVVENRHGLSVPKNWYQGTKTFIEKLGYDQVYDCMEIASAKKPYSKNAAFKYFCGICWNKIKRAQNG